MQAAVDIRALGNFGLNPEADSKGVYVLFRKETMKNELKSREQNRPIVEEVVFIEKHLPGGRDIVSRPATERDFDDFPKAYAFFKKKDKSPDDVAGTPLSELSFLNASRVMEFRLMNVFTVEQLSELSDSALQSMGMGTREERAKAKAWLQASKDGAFTQKQQDEINELKRLLESSKEEARDLKAVVAALKERVERGDDVVETRKGRGNAKSIRADSARDAGVPGV